MTGWADGVGGLPGPGLSPGGARNVADQLRAVAAVATAARDLVAGVGPDAWLWSGTAAAGYAETATGMGQDIEGLFDTLVLASTVVRDAADDAEAAATRIQDLDRRLVIARAAMDTATEAQVRADAAAVLDRQVSAETSDAKRLRALAADLPGAPPAICSAGRRVAPRWTGQQTRDLVRGIGDAVWDAGPGELSMILRLATVPGRLGVFDDLDHVENVAKRDLDAWGGGRTDTATNRAAYASASVATVFIPGPSGKGRAAAAVSTHVDDVISAPADAAWVGEGGEWLTTDALAAVDEFRARAVDIEPRITAIMDDVLVGLPTVTAKGRENVVKGAESLRRKVATAIGGGGEPTPTSDVIEMMNDSVRYTFESSTATVVRDANVLTKRLVDAGLVPTAWSSRWSGDTYRGINSTWRDPTGFQVEVQFHTADSRWAKEYTHGWYKEVRLPSVDPEAADWLRRIQGQIFRTVPEPYSLDRLVDPRRIMR